MTQPPEFNNPASPPKPSPGKRLRTLFFFLTLGVILGVATLLDLLLIYLVRKRRGVLGRGGALARLAMTPTHRAIWTIGIWIGLLTLGFLMFRLLTEGGANHFAAGLP